MVILTEEVYHKVTEFIRKFRGLAIECEASLKDKFTDLEPKTLESILAREWQHLIKQKYPHIVSHARRLLREYETESVRTGAHRILLHMAVREQFSPIGLCRILLCEKYKDVHTRAEVNIMLRNPNLIRNSLLAINVGTCLYNDTRDGPLSDMIRQCIGEEYEMKLKALATAAGIEYCDENDLRRMGYDKTPDLKLAVPFLFRGSVINWIESKASFGDIESHHQYLQNQLVSYANRFGNGMVIYWFGYLDKIAMMSENFGVVTVADNFPEPSELVLMDFGDRAVKDLDDYDSDGK